MEAFGIGILGFLIAGVGLYYGMHASTAGCLDIIFIIKNK